MNFNNKLSDVVVTWRAGVRGKLVAWLRARVIWITSDTRDLDGQAPRAWSLLAVWGREHYTETVVEHAIAKWSDAASVARLHRHGRRPVMFHIGPFQDGKRRIFFYELTAAAESFPARALFWLPESMLLSLACAPDCIFTVVRKGTQYFLSSEGTQLSGGLIDSSVNFALARGVRAGWHDRLVDEEAARALILTSLPRVSLATWFSSIGPLAQQVLQKVSVPLVAGVVALWLSFMVLGQLYLSVTFELRQRALDRLGADVSTLLESQRKLDILVAEQDDYLEAAGKRRSVLPVWAGFDAVWKSGGLVRSAKWVDGNVSLNGASNDATTVLAVISKDELASKAQFGAAVRQGNNLQEFMINFETKQLPSGAAGKK